MLFTKNFNFIFAGLSILLPAVLMLPVTAMSAEPWTLEKSISHAIEVSPDIRASDAEIRARQGALKQSGAWPNPSIEFNVNDKLGIDDNTGGSDLTQVAITQPITLGRLTHQRKQAKARLLIAEQDHLYRQLLLENKAAHNFHRLQLAVVKLKLANEKLRFAMGFQTQGSSNDQPNDPVVRYLSPLEKKRLSIIRETAAQFVATAAGEFREALAAFKISLKLPDNTKIKTAALSLAQLPTSLDALLNHQRTGHAAILAAKHRREAANAAISLVRAERFADPTLTIFRERDILNGSRQYYTALSVSIPIPLWNKKRGDISRARSEAERARYELEIVQRELQTKLSENHIQLTHLIDRAQHYRSKILVPAKEVFTLTRKIFYLGDVNILSLIDAHNTYFNAREHHLKLLYESRLKEADLRLAAGLSITNNNDSNGAKP